MKIFTSNDENNAKHNVGVNLFLYILQEVQSVSGISVSVDMIL